MSEITEIAAASMAGDTKRLEIIGNNIANINTPGFKRAIALHQFQQARVANQPGTTGQASVPGADFILDHRPGALQKTGSLFDVAIEGEGLFEVMTEDGVRYTRDGRFVLDQFGRLATSDGHVVVGEGGEIHIGTEAFNVDRHGEIIGDNGRLGQLKVVNFSDLNKLRPAGHGLYDASGTNPVSVVEPQLRQGFSETSNVEAADEMVHMMTIAQHFQAASHVVRSYDEAIGLAISTLSDM